MSTATTVAPSPRKVQASFNSSPGYDWVLLTSITGDVNLGNLGQANGGAFPSYQWRPTQAVGPTQEVYELDGVPQPLQNVSISLAVGFLVPEQRWGRWGFDVGPSLLWASGTNGTLQQWSTQFIWSPPCNGLWDKLYIVTGPGFRFINEPVGDQPGETVAVPRTNGSAPVPSGPITTQAITPVYSLGIGLDLSLISSAASSLLGTKTPAASGSGGQ